MVAVKRVDAMAISATDYFALGDGSGTKVDQWLVGGQYSRGFPDLAAMRTATGIADLQLTDTIDWAAITQAAKVAREGPVHLRPGKYRIERTLTFEWGGLEGETAGSGVPWVGAEIGRNPPGTPPIDRIRLNAPVVQRHFHFRNILIQGGVRGIYATGTGSISQQSIFEHIGIGGSQQEGIFFDISMAPIGIRFDHIRVEGCGSHGIRFRGPAQLNAAHFVNCRSAANGGHGFVFENTSTQSDQPAMLVSSCISEYNKGAGMKFVGCQATLMAVHFEGNDSDATGGLDNADLALGSSGGVHSRVTVIGGYWSGGRHPQRLRACALNPTQVLVLITPTIRGGAVKTSGLSLTVLPTVGSTVQQIP